MRLDVILLVAIGVFLYFYLRNYFKNSLYVPVRKYDNELEELNKTENGDWIDLYCTQDIKYKAGDTVTVDFGVGMVLPDGYEAIIAPRSSTFKHTGLLLTNGVGVIDNSYSGEGDVWKAMFYATRDGEITRNQRLAHFRVLKNQPHLLFDYYDRFTTSPRGGYGTSGK